VNLRHDISSDPALVRNRDTLAFAQFYSIDRIRGAVSGAICERHPFVPGRTATWQEVEPYFSEIKAISFAINGYDGVKTNNVWRQLYQVKLRQLACVEGPNEKLGLPEDSAPCHMCGLVLPLSSIDIDHQRPQAGGESEAVAKVFRAFGLTMQGAVGSKGLAISSMLSDRTNAISNAMLFHKTIAPLGTKRTRGPSRQVCWNKADARTVSYTITRT